EDDDDAGRDQQKGDEPHDRVQHFSLGYAWMAQKVTPIAVITGASSGIGAATAIALGRQGFRIVAGARRVERLERVAGEEGVALHLDVTDESSVNEFVREVGKRFGRIDVLVNNAGGALSLVRFHGDRKAARAVYEGLKPLTAEDIADCVVFAVTRPPHVDIDEIVVRPVAQATVWQVARKPSRKKS